tara:strand:- start:634 stop:1092 length:459 start_codon:yes stop_codon:yes gene_type:complete
MKLQTIPISIKDANLFVENFHRHNKPVRGAKFSIGASYEDKLVGVAIVGRPVARRLDDGFTAEAVRVCVISEAPKNTNSFLYGRIWRIWQQMGGKRMITYTLQSESGSSLKGAGYKIIGETGGWEKGKGWTTRPGREWQPVVGQMKFKWERE